MQPPEFAHRTRAQKRHLLPGIVRETAAIVWDSSRTIARRKLSWEKAPLVREALKQTFSNAIVNVHGWLLEQTDQDSLDARIAIFGDRNPDSQEPLFTDLELLGKGWNSLAYSFNANGKKWVVKVGAFASPDGAFFPHPSTPQHAEELNENKAILLEGMEMFGLPDLIAKPQVIHYTTFPNSFGKQLKRTVHIMPFEQTVPLEKVAEDARTDPNVAHQLQGDLDRYTNLRRWMQTKHHSDFDLDGEDNVAIVQNPEGSPQKYSIRVLDLGLRIHGLNTPLADLKFDILSVINATRLRRAIYGRKPREKGGRLGERIDKTLAFVEEYLNDLIPEALFVVDGRGLRREIRRKHLLGALVHARDFLAGKVHLDGTPIKNR